MALLTDHLPVPLRPRLQVRHCTFFASLDGHHGSLLCACCIAVTWQPSFRCLVGLELGNLMDDLMNLSFNDTPPPPTWGASGSINLGQSQNNNSAYSTSPSTPTAGKISLLILLCYAKEPQMHELQVWTKRILICFFAIVSWRFELQCVFGTADWC
jgi:hypothetical protein